MSSSSFLPVSGGADAQQRRKEIRRLDRLPSEIIQRIALELLEGEDTIQICYSEFRRNGRLGPTHSILAFSATCRRIRQAVKFPRISCLMILGLAEEAIPWQQLLPLTLAPRVRRLEVCFMESKDGTVARCRSIVIQEIARHMPELEELIISHDRVVGMFEQQFPSNDLSQRLASDNTVHKSADENNARLQKLARLELHGPRMPCNICIKKWILSSAPPLSELKIDYPYSRSFLVPGGGEAISRPDSDDMEQHTLNSVTWLSVPLQCNLNLRLDVISRQVQNTFDVIARQCPNLTYLVFNTARDVHLWPEIMVSNGNTGQLSLTYASRRYALNTDSPLISGLSGLKHLSRIGPLVSLSVFSQEPEDLGASERLALKAIIVLARLYKKVCPTLRNGGNWVFMARFDQEGNEEDNWSTWYEWVFKDVGETEVLYVDHPGIIIKSNPTYYRFREPRVLNLVPETDIEALG
ncbi:hypothetical protein BD324DRAFT_621252 [Kockovaella imperatae]|uniref:F-box domain-containing protein n=1 Tax=Kockovaella imperatae TaxID=4999 RepID=A0A1Y1UKJ8_9TREE|nr:hypothetical protein BD324DRAFT_621252 [Kockovaella imperatae]ORX38529.1 hypothetical protein BD324DRAFT_621252 [Kockovaella imperatae]